MNIFFKNMYDTDFAPYVHILVACLCMLFGVAGNTAATVILGLIGLVVSALSYNILDRYFSSSGR